MAMPDWFKKLLNGGSTAPDASVAPSPTLPEPDQLLAEPTASNRETGSATGFPRLDLSAASQAGDGAAGIPLEEERTSPSSETILRRIEVDEGVLNVTGHPLSYAFGHGRIHGQWRIEEGAYPAYLRLKAQEESLEAEIKRCEEEIQGERNKRAHVAKLQGEAAGKKVEIHYAAEQIKQAEGRKAKAEQAIEHAQDKLHALKGRGSFTYLMIYGLAGVVFIVGDVALARYTVSVALRMMHWEGWAFAIGLALLAIVLKPVYDRLIEDQYHEGAKRAFIWSIILAAIFVGVFLIIMGGYRSNFMQWKVEADQLEEQVTRLKQERDNASQFEQTELTAEISKEIERVQARQEEHSQKLLGDRWGHYALLLSQLLFAIAGAICLGIATRNWRDWRHHIRPLRLQLWDSRHALDPRRRGPLYRHVITEEQSAQVAIEQKLKLEQEVHNLEAQIAMFESESDALAQIEKARERSQEVHQTLRDVRVALHPFLYATGYELGKKFPEPALHMVEAGGAVLEPSWGAQQASVRVGNAGGSREAGQRRHRLYIAVREAVRRAAVKPPSTET